MAFVPTRFRTPTSIVSPLPGLDRPAADPPEELVEPVKGSPFSVGGAAYIAFCQSWAPPFDLDELDLFDEVDAGGSLLRPDDLS